MNKKKIGIALLCIFAIYTIYAHYHKKTSLAFSAAVLPTIVQVQVVKPVAVPVEVQTIGTLTASSVNIIPEVAGHVDKIFFQDGQFVQQGTPLIQLDDAVYKSKYASAAAQFGLSQAEYRRTALLGKQGAVTRQAIDKAKADLREQQANMEESAVMLSKMLLRAPFSGVVGEGKVGCGDYVTVGQTLVTLTDTKHLRVQYHVSEQYLPLLKLRQSITIQSTTYPNKQFTGVVSFISPTIDTQTDSVSLYADVQSDQHGLIPGMFVNVTQLLGKQKNTIMVPTRALIPLLEGQQIYKVIDHKAYAVNVQIGKRLNENVEIIQGITDGDIIITDGQTKIKNGDLVMEKN